MDKPTNNRKSTRGRRVVYMPVGPARIITLNHRYRDGVGVVKLDKPEIVNVGVRTVPVITQGPKEIIREMRDKDKLESMYKFQDKQTKKDIEAARLRRENRLKPKTDTPVSKQPILKKVFTRIKT